MASVNEDDNIAPSQELLIRADEVDVGTTVLAPGGQKPLSALTPADAVPSTTVRPKPPPRPTLRRDGSAPPPPPPSQPPPAPPQQPEDVTDSLSLPQLRQLVSQFPKAEQRAYAFTYQDAEDFMTEIDEWFHYTEVEQDRDYLLAAREAFEQRWRAFCETDLNSKEPSWIEVDSKHHQSFVKQLAADFGDDDTDVRQEAVAALFCILVGVWNITAGVEDKDLPDDRTETELNNAYQVRWMHSGVDIAVEAGVLDPLFRCMRNALDRPLEENKNLTDDGEYVGAFDDVEYRGISFCFSCFYIIIESSRSRLGEDGSTKARQSIMALKPNFLVFMAATISRLRWDESYNIPLMHALQLLWKSMLFAFGDIKNHLEKIKGILQPRVDPFSSEASKPILTASPLDYHLFRQEITSKYPAYNPPLPVIPIELEQKTMLPPLPHQTARTEFEILGKSSAPTGSIMHQPVHIATPAPSPPPSPGGPGGKGGKKQNYQTNQNFPFLYPPLDTESNNIGGKGSTEHQDMMVGRKWEGSDIPASIIEAGELFSSRMRMTRAMRQLWKERDSFMKYDRGWKSDKVPEQSTEARMKEEEAETESKLEDTLHDPDLQSRMNAVEEFFHDALPDLQSLVIVMMKVMLTNVQDIAVRNGQLQDHQQPQSALNRTKSNSNLNAAPNSLPLPPPPPLPSEISLDDLDNIRSREISQKAISACIFLMLKWFKIGHVLKFEYLTQLLLDSNYIQLTLKYFAHQNLEDLVAFKYDRDDLSFWHYCHLHSDHPPLSPAQDHQSDDEGSEDEAVPPPIQRHRRSPSGAADATTPAQSSSGFDPGFQQMHPTVDELGNPLTDLPSSPIITFSSRQFHTAISLLRILQKVTRSKSHRILLLVQFKSSQILRRILRVPEPMLRLYVLKLFKSQVPYCGRKWRQSNMRVITAIYLHCRPELRDEWLAGMHDSNMDGEVDEAVPLEWGLRGLTFWWQKRTYPEVMKLKLEKNSKNDDNSQAEEGGQEIEDDERDFFQRELDAMGWGLAGMGLADGEDVGFGEEAPGIGVEVNGMNGQHHPVNNNMDSWQ